MTDYAWTLAATIVVELIVAMAVTRRGSLPRRGHLTLMVVALNLFTHPLATLAVSAGGQWWLVEALVTAAEAALLGLLTPWSWMRAVGMALGMNMGSALVGAI